MKIKSILAAAALTIVASSAFATNTVVTLVQDPVNAAKYTGGFNISHTSAFTDTFTFSPSFQSSTVSTVLTSIGFDKVTNIDFTSVKLNGVALSITNGVVDVAQTLTQLNLTGPLTLVVSGKAGVANTPNFNASYSGTINVTAVPEPETFAMLGAGLALVGFAARRRKAANQA
ncbi:FxDxF family PEP-CTERM protein [Duganella levis]|uniref:PEP-CTERM sorting domain-containing protein n=1 Tax=Duganella levis TaxID=2692169 RepID=A0ABW9W538_9BURK|nr:FxDxF family PEP-CTERM protein [Duganella levis]MYN29063.1 PEP-CTERM sorting domain-containing protein [Duganella levis]